METEICDKNQYRDAESELHAPLDVDSTLQHEYQGQIASTEQARGAETNELARK